VLASVLTALVRLALVRLASGMVSQQALARAFQQALVLKALERASADPVGLALLAVQALLVSPPLLADL
jgi:hypothetical protein